MTSRYLDKFLSVLPKVQGGQILRILTSERDSGKVRGLEEFKARLKELTQDLISQKLAPTLKLYLAVGGVETSSDQYNYMLKRIEDDLEAIFAEANNIDEVIDAHRQLISNVALTSLRLGVNQLEARVKLYEFINSNAYGFDQALFNTFRDASRTGTSRADERTAALVFVDPRKGETIFSDEDASIDFIGERVTLGLDSQDIPIRDVIWLSNSQSIRGELDVSFKNSRISNIIDGQQGTYWVVPILLDSKRTVPLQLNLNLDKVHDINSIDIEPASKAPMLLTGIDYTDANGDTQSLNISSTLLQGPVRLVFEEISAKSVTIKVRQDNYTETQFNQTDKEINFHRAVLGEKPNDVDLLAVEDDLKQVLSSQYIIKDILGIKASNPPRKKFYEYILGFDNVRLGFGTYDSRGIFVSAKKSVSKPGLIGLSVDEKRPTQISTQGAITLSTHTYPARTASEDLKFYHSSVEYYIACQSFTSDNFLIATDIIPILPIGASRIYHERVIFTEKDTGATEDNLAPLRFYTLASGTDVIVYRNGVSLTYSTDWEFVAVGDSSGLTNETPNNGSRMQRAIRINNEVEPLDVYTVSYTPKVANSRAVLSSSGLLDTVDLIGDRSFRMVTENLLVMNKTRLSYEVDHADFYLMVLMRRNSAQDSYTPTLEEFTLSFSSRNQERFIVE